MASGSDRRHSSEPHINTESGTLSPDQNLCSSFSAISPAEAPQCKSSYSAPLPALSLMPSTASIFSPAVEATPLLPASSHCCSTPPPTKPLSNAEYFVFILRHRRIISSMLLGIISSKVYNSFNATLVLHVQELFHWSPRQVGFLFLALIGPSVLFGLFAG